MTANLTPAYKEAEAKSRSAEEPMSSCGSLALRFESGSDGTARPNATAARSTNERCRAACRRVRLKPQTTSTR
jgi:hypothetical protein